MTTDIHERVAEVIAGPGADPAKLDDQTRGVYLRLRAKMKEHWMSVAETLIEAFPQLAEEPEYEYTWVGEDWVLDQVFATLLEAAEFGGSANGLWVQMQGGKLVRRRRAGEWEEVE